MKKRCSLGTAVHVNTAIKALEFNDIILQREDSMKIAIIGSGIEVFTCGHRLLDKNSNLEIHIFDEKAESGMYGEEPGLFANGH